MIIDFHAHIFPDKIAANTIKKLERQDGTKAYCNGTQIHLQQSMKEAGIDLSVILPVATRVEQFNTINAFAVEISKQPDIISFGGIHPDTPNPKQALKQIKEMGLLGIKLHPDFQDTFIDDKRYITIIYEALQLDLMISIHGGLDKAYPDLIHCPPKRALSMLRQTGVSKTDSTRIILAHMGAFEQWKEVEELLCGENIYFDLGYTFSYLKDNDLIRLMRKHGISRILFATDSPWRSQMEYVDYMKKLPLTEKEKSAILGENAKNLLKDSIKNKKNKN